jgi:hypothetical protein
MRLIPLLVCSVMALALSTAARAETKFTFIDLQPRANQKLADDLHESQGNNLAKVPTGEQKLADVPFKLGEKMIHLKGAHSPSAPEKVEGIKVGAKFDRLHILHSTGYGNDPAVGDGTEIGAYVVHYADGATERIPIVYGEDLRDWWVMPDKPAVKRAKVAWEGTNAAAEGMGTKIRLYRVEWTNPHPEKEVATIDAVSKGLECDPFLIALTLEKK